MRLNNEMEPESRPQRPPQTSTDCLQGHREALWRPLSRIDLSDGGPVPAFPVSATAVSSEQKSQDEPDRISGKTYLEFGSPFDSLSNRPFGSPGEQPSGSTQQSLRTQTISSAANELVQSNPHLQLKKLQQEAKLALGIARRMHFSAALHLMRDALKKGNAATKEFKHCVRTGRSEDEQAQAFLAAREAFNEVKEQAFSSPGAEKRACWIDRKTIVSAGPGELSKEIKELAAAGVNTIYFECDNGGYATYDSKLLERNPDLAKWGNWDPLREAIDAAHASGIKLEGWNKSFLGCNLALNEKLRQDHPALSIPWAGPVLSKHESSVRDQNGDWALRQTDGKMQQGSNDLFLDPANPEVRKFVQDIMVELVTRYPDIDGLQYDYIRYPFHNEELGLNDNNWRSFQAAFPVYKKVEKPAAPGLMDSALRRAWNEWKASQIDSFVEATSTQLLKLNPRLDIAAAVYPCDLNESVRQHWAIWANRGWLKTINPMTYVPHDPASHDAELSRANAAKFKADVEEVANAVTNKTATILPGIETARVNAKGVQEETGIVKALGLPGESLFAASVLNASKLEDFELEDARDSFSRFFQFIHVAWSGGDASKRQPHREFLRDADSCAQLIQRLSISSTVADLNHAAGKLESLQRELANWLKQNREENTEWTGEFMKCLSSSLNSIRVAATPVHFAAWDGN